MTFSGKKSLFAALVCVVVVCVGAMTGAAQATKPSVAALRAITVISEPDAIVWIDGVKYGKTAQDGRLTISTVAPGRRLVRVRADGFKEVTKSLLAAQKGNVDIPLTKTTDEAELAYQQAEVLAETDREKAAAAYNKAIRLRPLYAEALIGLARLYADGRKREEAENAVKAVRKIRPRSAEASRYRRPYLQRRR